MHSYENRGSAAASSAAAEPATLDLPEATPWTGNWSHLIAAWLFGVVILSGLVTFIIDLFQRCCCLVPRPQAGAVAAAVPEPAAACVR